MFKAQAGIFAVHIPTTAPTGAAGAAQRQVDFNIDNLASAAPNIRSGSSRRLPSPRCRLAALPEVPPMADTLKVLPSHWWGLVAPAATPKDVIAKLNQLRRGAQGAGDAHRFAA